MSELRARLDALLNDAEDKAYRVIADVTEAADAVLDSVFEVIDDVQGRVADLKEKADQGVAGTGSPFAADFWKDYTYDMSEAAAPVAEETLQEKAKRAYYFLTETEEGYKREFDVRDTYWKKYYSEGSLATNMTWNSLVRRAEALGFE